MFSGLTRFKHAVCVQTTCYYRNHVLGIKSLLTSIKQVLILLERRSGEQK